MFYFGLLIASAPFLLPFRSYPDGDYYPNALALTLLLLPVALRFKDYTLAPAALNCAFLALVILVSGQQSGSYYYDSWMIPGFVLLFSAIFISGASAISEREKDSLADGLMFGLATGGLYSILIAFFQHQGETSYLGALALRNESGIFANFGQRNLFSTYILCACIALCYLHSQKKLTKPYFLLFITAAAYILTAAGSRMVLLDLLFLSTLAISITRSRYFERMSDFCFSIAIFILIQTGFQLAMLTVDTGGASRIKIDGDTHRIGEWIKAYNIFLDNPLGVGYGNYAATSFNYHLNGYSPESELTWTHSHNILLQLLVELGLWALPIFAFGGYIYAKLTAHCIRNVRGVALIACINLILIHSLLEYPLWQMNFLVIFISFIACSTAKQKAYRINSFRFFAAAAVTVITVTTWRYVEVVEYSLPSEKVSENIKRLSELTSLSATPSLGWAADKVLINYLTIDDAPDSTYSICNAIRLATREPLHPYLERVALIALARQDFKLASSVLKSRYKAYPSAPDNYLVSNIRHLWPQLSGDYEDKIKALKASNFQKFSFFRLEAPSYCI